MSKFLLKALKAGAHFPGDWKRMAVKENRRNTPKKSVAKQNTSSTTNNICVFAVASLDVLRNPSRFLCTCGPPLCPVHPRLLEADAELTSEPGERDQSLS